MFSAVQQYFGGFGVTFLRIYLKFLFYRTTQSVFTAAGVDVVDFADGTLKFKSRNLEKLRTGIVCVRNRLPRPVFCAMQSRWLVELNLTDHI